MKYFILLGLLLWTTIIYSQKVAPQVISSAGDIVENSDIKISWTLGEFSVATIGSDPKLTQGFQQSKLLIETDVSESLFTDKIKVFPNPTQELIFIEIKGISGPVYAELSDVNGNLIFKKSFNNQVQIKVSQLPPGIYFARISIKGIPVYTSKISKI